jgi:hypothetical protein
MDSYTFKIQPIVDDYNLVSEAKMDPSEHAYYLLQGIPNDEEWKLFKRLIRSQNLGPVSASDSESKSKKSLEREPAGLVTAMLNQEANILKDRIQFRSSNIAATGASKRAPLSQGQTVMATPDFY